MPATLTKSGRSPVAGSHKLSDHWEHQNLIVLHGTGADEPVLRVCIRGSEPGDSVWVDMKAREADRFARCIFAIAGYDVPKRRSRGKPPWQRQGLHWNVYSVRKGVHGVVRHKICLFNHGGPVHCRATWTVPRVHLERLSQWLAPRLGWELYEDAA